MYLRSHGRDAPFAHGRDFGGQGLASDASGSVVTDASIGDVDGSVVDDDGVRHCPVIDRHVRDVSDIVHRAVVIETVSVPISALVTDADVAESIVDAAIIADVLAPIAVVIAVIAAYIPPITGSPQIAHLGRLRPCAGYPEIALRTKAPIAGRPEVAITGAVRLRIFRKLRRRSGSLKDRLTVV